MIAVCLYPFTLGIFTQIIFVIALVNPHLAVVDFEDPVRQRAQEVAVVAYEHYGAAVFLQGSKEDLPALDVEVVGGLIEDEEVVRLGEQHRKYHPALLAAGEYGYPFIHIVAGKEKGTAEVADRADGCIGHGVLHGLEDGAVRMQEVEGMLAEIAG